MAERTINWSIPATDHDRVRGALSACRAMVDQMPTDGTWHKCIVPWAGANSSGASQAKLRLQLDYPMYEFKTVTKDGCRWMLARYKAEEA